MEEINETELQEEQQPYVPRPAWQVWGARIAAVIFAGLIVLQVLRIAGVGLS